MKKILLTLLGLSLLAGNLLYLSNANKNISISKADSTQAELLFGHGTAGVDEFYNYCPSIMEESDGTRHIYYCTNRDAGDVTDYVGYRKGTLQNDGSYSWSSETLVLSPTSGMWDSRHTCDPSVIKGSFKYLSHNYSYLMAYLGCITSDNSNNEVGLAVSDNPIGPWTKVDSLNPFAHFTGTSGYEGWEWGYGQPSLISIDKAGKVLFTFTAGEKSGTHIYVEKWDLSNLNSPSQLASRKQVGFTGLTKVDGSGDSVLNNVDFAYDEASGRMYGIRDNHPSATVYPEVATAAQLFYVEPHNSDKSIGGNLFKYATFKVIKDINQSVSGLARNHNCGLVRDEYGHLNNPSQIEVVITDGIENSNWWSALASYRLYSYKVDINRTTNDYTIDVGANITYTQTSTDYLATFRMLPNDNNWSSGNAIALRIRNNTGIDTPIRMAFNCTNDSRNRVISNTDESKKYYLLSKEGTLSEYAYRTWDGDVWLKPNFDGWLIMKKDDQVTDTSYNNQGTFSWNSIYAMYFTIQTQYDSYANYDVGDIYCCNFISNQMKLVKPVLQCGLVDASNTSNNFAKDYYGEYVNIARNNSTFILVVNFIDQLINVNTCGDTSSIYATLLSQYNSLHNNGLFLSYFENAVIYDYAYGDTSHSGGLSSQYMASAKWAEIVRRNTNQYSNYMNFINNSYTPILLVVIAFIICSSLGLFIFIKKRH